MDQDLTWWAEVVFAGWRGRPGPRYARLAAALLEAINQQTVARGTRVPAERTLAATVGTSRGTVVACFDQLVEAGVLTRRQGAGTYVAGRPSWAARTGAGTVATRLLRRVAEDRETIDLSVSAPGDLRHLPPAEAEAAWQSLDGHGLDPAGLPGLRAAIARHLTEHQGLPTEPGQLVVTAGAQEALWLLSRVLPGTRVLASCPTYPGLAGAIAGTRAEIIPLPADAAGEDANAVERAGRAPGGIAYLMPTGHNPTGAVMPLLRRQALAAIADAGRVTVVEDLTLADLPLGPAGGAPPPLAALSTRVIAVGSASKVLWGGLRVGWIRAGEPLRSAVIARKSALNLGTAVISQALAARLLETIDAGWLAAHRAALTERRDLLAARLAEHLPAWRARPPEAGLSLWAELPVDSADAFTLAAARHGVAVMPGSTACADGRHRHFIRLSFAEQPGTLELAVERLAAAWEVHAETLATSPARG
ncbi:MAG TPA: PLP-dependent aminotransferase family protein [Trebonia sp.]|jgi:DNA-binding transcriptional MocR family regulator